MLKLIKKLKNFLKEEENNDTKIDEGLNFSNLEQIFSCVYGNSLKDIEQLSINSEFYYGECKKFLDESHCKLNKSVVDLLLSAVIRNENARYYFYSGENLIKCFDLLYNNSNDYEIKRSKELSVLGVVLCDEADNPVKFYALNGIGNNTYLAILSQDQKEKKIEEFKPQQK